MVAVILLPADVTNPICKIVSEGRILLINYNWPTAAYTMDMIIGAEKLVEFHPRRAALERAINDECIQGIPVCTCRVKLPLAVDAASDRISIRVFQPSVLQDGSNCGNTYAIVTMDVQRARDDFIPL